MMSWCRPWSTSRSRRRHTDPVAVGGRITYTVTVTNNGPTLDPGPISISDNLPVSLIPVTAGGPGVTCGILLQLVTCTSDAPLGVDASLTVTIVADVLPSAYPSVTNVALVSTASTETDLSNNTATDTATVTPLVRLALVKTLGETALGSATWLLTVTNLGPNNTVQPIVVVDQLPVGLTYVSATGNGWVCTHASGRVECTYAASLAVGAAAPVITLVTAVTAPPGTSIVNTATVSGGGPEVPSVTDDAQVDRAGAVAGNGLVQRQPAPGRHDARSVRRTTAGRLPAAAPPSDRCLTSPVGGAQVSCEITSDCSSPYFSKRSSAVPPRVKSGMISSSKPSST